METRQLFSHFPSWNRSGIRVWEPWVVLALCVVAGVRIFLFSAAFPFFNNVDEPSHFDVVYKYAHGHFPRGKEDFSEKSSEVIATFSSPEYLFASDDIFNPKDFTKEELLMLNPTPPKRGTSCRARWNHETAQPPLYYGMAAIWYHIGESAGLTGLRLLYWIRFYYVGVYGVLILLSWWFVKRYFSDRPFFRIGIIAMLVFFSQDAFYSISNDGLSALTFFAAFVVLVDLCVAATRRWTWYVLAAALMAAAILTKLSNIVIIGVFAVVFFARLIRAWSGKQWKREIALLCLMSVIAAIPVVIWVAAYCGVGGVFSFFSQYLEWMGWKRKTWTDIPFHPIFTLKGVALFIGNLTRTFWRGEFVWHRKCLASVFVDHIYVYSTVFFFFVSFCYSVFRCAKCFDLQQIVRGLSFLSCVLFVLFLGWISVSCDFGSCYYPSHDYPYMTSGRLIIGCLVPFLILYLDGVDVLLRKIGIPQARFIVLLLVIAVMLFSETILSLGAFRSNSNWFHILS